MKYKTEEERRLAGVYNSMKARCSNPKTIGYKYYGGKGICVCDEWKNDIQKFFKWALSNGYKIGLTIDHIDSNKNYCPENCQWLTRAENTHKAACFNYKTIKAKGLLTPTQLVELTGLSYGEISRIINCERRASARQAYFLGRTGFSPAFWLYPENYRWNPYLMPNPKKCKLVYMPEKPFFGVATPPHILNKPGRV